MNRNKIEPTEDTEMKSNTQEPNPTGIEYKQIDSTDWYYAFEENGTHHYRNDSPGNPIAFVSFSSSTRPDVHDDRRTTMIINVQFQNRINKTSRSKLHQSFSKKIKSDYSFRHIFRDSLEKTDKAMTANHSCFTSTKSDAVDNQDIMLSECKKYIDILSAYSNAVVARHMLAHVILQDKIVERYFILSMENLKKLSAAEYVEDDKTRFKDFQQYLLANFREEIIQELRTYCVSDKMSVCGDFFKSLQEEHGHCFGLLFEVAKVLERSKLIKQAIALYEMIESTDPDYDEACYEIAHIEYIARNDKPQKIKAAKPALEEEDKGLDSEDEPENKAEAEIKRRAAEIEKRVDTSNRLLSIFFRMGGISEKASGLLLLVCLGRLATDPMQLRSRPDPYSESLSKKIATLVNKEVGEGPIDKSSFLERLNKITITHFMLLANRNIPHPDSGTDSSNSEVPTSASLSSLVH